MTTSMIHSSFGGVHLAQESHHEPTIADKNNDRTASSILQLIGASRSTGDSIEYLSHPALDVVLN